MTDAEYYQLQLEQQEMEQDPDYINWLISLDKQQIGERDEFRT
jgi:hypothetical protein